MKIIKTNRIAVAVAAIGLTAAPFLSGVAQAKDNDKGRNDSKEHRDSDKRDSDKRDKDHNDNGKHKGWTQGEHKGWDKNSKPSPTPHTSYPKSYPKKPSVSGVWKRSTNPTPSRRLVGTFYHSTREAAAKAVRFAQSKGYYATSTYSSTQRVWIVRTYTR